jgi:hypothetical protein
MINVGVREKSPHSDLHKTKKNARLPRRFAPRKDDFLSSRAKRGDLQLETKYGSNLACDPHPRFTDPHYLPCGTHPRPSVRFAHWGGLLILDRAGVIAEHGI